jgi:hypothetical protein
VISKINVDKNPETAQFKVIPALLYFKMEKL